LAVSQYNAELDSYYDEVNDYNDEVEDFEEAIYAYYQDPTFDKYVKLLELEDDLEDELRQLNRWARSLRNQASLLDEELNSLGLQKDSFGGVLGVVKEVKMYW